MKGTRGVRAPRCAATPSWTAPRGAGPPAAPLRSAIEAAGYREEASAAVHLQGDGATLYQALASKLCTALIDPRYLDLGAPRARAQHPGNCRLPIHRTASRCGNRDGGRTARAYQQRAQRRASLRQHAIPSCTAKLRLDARPGRAAAVHADDMLAHDYFEHVGSDGSTSSTRVAAIGYRYRVVGENIAFGPENVTQAVQGWLKSPSHCENIMDPRFSDTGIAFAASSRRAPRIYRVEEFGAQRRAARRGRANARPSAHAVGPLYLDSISAAW